MRIFSSLFIALALLISVPILNAYADSYVDTSGLTDAQKAKLAADAAQMKLDQVNGKADVQTTAAQLSEYADLGQKYGVALAAVAKELGKTVDEIMHTDVGLIALVLIVWKIMGHDMIGIFGGIMWFTFVMPIWAFVFYRMILKAPVWKETYNDAGKRISRERQVRSLKDEATSVGAVVMFIVFLILCIPGWSMIF